jgi:hypothetical protein
VTELGGSTSRELVLSPLTSRVVGAGTSAYADAGAPPIDVTHSFTVSAWVRLDRTTGYQTVVVVDGDQVSNARMQQHRRRLPMTNGWARYVG